MPRRALPKWKSKPVTAGRWRDVRSGSRATNSSALGSANARSNGYTSVPSKPSAATSAAFIGAGVRRNSGTPGKEGARMRLERQHDAGTLETFRRFERASEHRLMAAMHAVEIADRDDAAAPGVRQRLGSSGSLNAYGREAWRSARGPGERRNVGDRGEPFRIQPCGDPLTVRSAMWTEVGGVNAAGDEERRHAVVDGAADVGRRPSPTARIRRAAELARPRASPRRRSARAACRRGSPRRRARHSGERARRRSRSAGRRAPPRCRDWRRSSAAGARPYAEAVAVILRRLGLIVEEPGAADQLRFRLRHEGRPTARRRSSGPCPARHA